MKHFQLLLILTIISISCKKNDTASNIDQMIGHYKGNVEYINFYSEFPALGMSNDTGRESNIDIKVSKKNSSNTELYLTYLFPPDDSIQYTINNLTVDNNQYYFNFPTQINEEGNPIEGNKCYNHNSTNFDGFYDINSKTLKLCTKYELTFHSIDTTYQIKGQTKETYIKN